MAGSTLQLGGPLKAQIEQQGGTTLITLSGYINEATSLAPLTKLPGALVIDLGKLDRINSLGVRKWMDFVKACEATGIRIVFQHVSPIMVGQISMITNFM